MYIAAPILADPTPLKVDQDGVIRVGGTRVTLQAIIYSYLENPSAEEIARNYPSVKLADIHSTIAYFLRHRTEVEGYIAEQEAACNAARLENEKRFPSKGFRTRLLSRNNQET